MTAATCPVCDAPRSEPMDFCEICRHCGFENGIDDRCGRTLADLRAAWVVGGCVPWTRDGTPAWMAAMDDGEPPA